MRRLGAASSKGGVDTHEHRLSVSFESARMIAVIGAAAHVNIADWSHARRMRQAAGTCCRLHRTSETQERPLVAAAVPVVSKYAKACQFLSNRS
jgi:hypothetical protein